MNGDGQGNDNSPQNFMIANKRAKSTSVNAFGDEFAN
jgi:hypothetical protein